VENPFVHDLTEGHEVGITLVLITLLAAVFLKGFNEAIGIAVAIVAIYITLNLIVIGRGFMELQAHPEMVSAWKNNLLARFPNPLLMLGAAALVFPRLALGLSGFETGVVVMPLVKGDPTDTPQKPLGTDSQRA
jgi:hypothetical protein